MLQAKHIYSDQSFGRRRDGQRGVWSPLVHRAAKHHRGVLRRAYSGIQIIPTCKILDRGNNFSCCSHLSLIQLHQTLAYAMFNQQRDRWWPQASKISQPFS